MSKENPTQQAGENPKPEIPKSSRIPNGTIINVVLFLGLIVLYALQFFPAKGTQDELAPFQESEMEEITDKLAEGAFNIAFVNSDSLMANYHLAIEMREGFEAEQRRLENDLERRQRNFQAEVQSFQNEIQTGAISMDAAQVKEQELMQKQQELIELNDTYSNRLMRQEMEMNNELYQRITELLERFNEEMGYDYILGFSPGGGILYAHNQHDITPEITRRLNEEYNEN